MLFAKPYDGTQRSNKFSKSKLTFGVEPFNLALEKREKRRENKTSSGEAAEILRCLHGTDCARKAHSATTDQSDTVSTQHIETGR